MFKHLPVLFDEVIESLVIKENGSYLDGTVGGGGHSSGIAQALTTGRLICMDQDPAALAAAKENLTPYADRTSFVSANFARLGEVARQLAPEGLDGILLDLGVSSHQIDRPERGFSYMQDGPLDMRMDPWAEKSAYDLVNDASQKELAQIIKDYGEESWADRVAALIVERRALAPITSTYELVDVIERAIPKGARQKGSHVAKRSFQALRIAINDELGVLEKAIDAGVAVLKPGGRLAIISFHSLEDRIVKERFRWWAKDCICPPALPICQCDKRAELKIITRKPILPSKEEQARNPRAASARLRVAEKK